MSQRHQKPQALEASCCLEQVVGWNNLEMTNVCALSMLIVDVGFSLFSHLFTSIHIYIYVYIDTYVGGFFSHIIYLFFYDHTPNL